MLGPMTGAGGAIASVVVAAAAAAGDPQAGRFTLEEATAGLKGAAGKPLMATIDTTWGQLTCALDDKEAPRVVANFIGLARGKRAFLDPAKNKWVKRPFYDELTFHKVVPGGLLWGGDIAGDGTGSPGYLLRADPPRQIPPAAGLLAAVGAGEAGAHGSQFVITTTPEAKLGRRDLVFGRCTPQSVIDRIAAVPRDDADRPLEPVKIRLVSVLRRGEKLPVFGVLKLADPAEGNRGDGRRDQGMIGSSAGEPLVGGLGLGRAIGSTGAPPAPEPRPVPKVEFGTPTVRGAMSADAIQKLVVDDTRGGMMVCYDDTLGAHPGLAGTLAVQMMIAVDGTVKKAERTGGTLHEDPLVPCVLGHLSALRFPPQGQKGIALVTMTLTFSQK